MAAMAAKPLRLKDLLELDCDSCSAAGFRCYPRHLCVAVPLPAVRHEVVVPEVHGVFGRSHSLRSIRRSLSRRLSGSFFSWRRRDDEPVPAAASIVSCSSHSETSESGSSSSCSAERKLSECGFSSPCSAESLHARGVTTTAADGQEHEVNNRLLVFRFLHTNLAHQQHECWLNNWALIRLRAHRLY